MTTGCVKRTISISSIPDGALVWVNDREMGRTPLSFDFTYYGEYDVRLKLDGFEPIMSSRWATSPMWDLPIIDLATEVVNPSAHSDIRWEFAFDPRNNDPSHLIQNATMFRKWGGFSR